MTLEFFNQIGKTIHLAKKLASGGEGDIYEIGPGSDLLAKIYKPEILRGRQGELEKKLPSMIALSNDPLLKHTAWPLDALYNKQTRRLAGFVMRRKEGTEIHQLYGPKSRIRDFPDAGWNFLIHTAINLAGVIELIHNYGHVIGDINARSVFVSKTAIVQLIDCDSFQIVVGSEKFPCHVGFPEFTPPELQNRSLHGLLRSQGHDSFGLAVLIFYLLFMGRHPFAGQYLGKGDKDLSESIREYRFAYGAGASSRNVRQPPGSPSLEIVPRQIAMLFERAFDSPHNRPAPAEWRSALIDLSHNLVRCNNGHYYLKSLADCPWCKLEREFSLKFFLGTILQNLGWRDFDLAKVWREISGITLPPDTFSTAPGALHQTLGLFKSGKVLGVGSEVLSLRRMLLTANLVLVVWLIGSFRGMLSPIEAGLFGFLIGILCLLIPYQGYARQRKKLESQKSLVEARSSKGRLLAQLLDEKQAFLRKRAELEAIKKQYENLGAELHQKLVELEKNARQRQLEKFLDSFDIYNARIPGIGEQRKATLISYGIETAADVHYSRIYGVVPGFASVNTNKLVAWRRGLENRFVFDPNKGVDPRDKQALEQEIALKRRNVETELGAGPVRLKQIIERVTQLQEQVRKDIELNSKDIEEVGKKLAFLLHLKELFVPLWGMIFVLVVWWLSVQAISQNLIQSSSDRTQSASSSTSDDTERAINLYKQGVGYTKSKQFERAIILYQQSITANPEYAEAYHELGYALFRLNRYDEAISACLRAISLRQNYADTHRNLAKCYSAKGDIDNQIHTLKAAIRLAPKHLESVYLLAEALFQKENYEEAAERYVVVLEMNPEFDKAWYKLGLLYLRTGSTEQAREIVDQLQSLNPDLANSLLAEIEKEIR